MSSEFVGKHGVITDKSMYYSAVLFERGTSVYYFDDTELTEYNIWLQFEKLLREVERNV